MNTVLDILPTPFFLKDGIEDIMNTYYEDEGFGWSELANLGFTLGIGFMGVKNSPLSPSAEWNIEANENYKNHNPEDFGLNYEKPKDAENDPFYISQTKMTDGGPRASTAKGIRNERLRNQVRAEGEANYNNFLAGRNEKGEMYTIGDWQAEERRISDAYMKDLRELWGEYEAREYEEGSPGEWYSTYLELYSQSENEEGLS